MTTRKHEIDEELRSLDVPPDAEEQARALRGAVKLTRADAVKLVAAELSELYRDEIERAEAAVEAARSALHRDVETRAWRENQAVLSPVVGERPSARVTWLAYRDGTDDGDLVDVTFADATRPYEARNIATVSVPVDDRLRSAWHLALAGLDTARDRDTRVSGMKREARELLIKTAMDGSDEGAALVAALKAFSRVARARMDHHLEGPCETASDESTKTRS